MSNLLKIILIIIIAYFLLGRSCSCSCSTKETFARGRKKGGKGAGKGAGKRAGRGAGKGAGKGADKGAGNVANKKLLNCDELEDYLFITTKEERGFEDKVKSKLDDTPKPPKDLPIRKWSKWVKIKIHEFETVKDTQQELIDELKKIKDEINELSLSNKVYLLDFPDELPESLKNEKPNYTLYLTSDEKIVKELPRLQNSVYHENGKIKNQGLFDLTIDSNNIITSARVWVNTSNADKKCVKHILREEVIQSFGMSNDLDFDEGDTSEKTKTIFNQKYNVCEHEFNDFDKKVIKTHLSNDVQPNDTRFSVHSKLKPDGCKLPENKDKPPSAGAIMLEDKNKMMKKCKNMIKQGIKSSLCDSYM